ncbi:hypothetical protein Mapa_014657 [Marchantia paleacea]|nr:hypothetical protein Mapa_014657 [Marchantia paleacea]
MLCPVCGRYPEKDGDYAEQQGGDRAKHKYCKQCRVKHVEFLLEEGLDKESFLTTWSSVNNGLFSDVKLVAKHGQAVPSHKAVLAGRSQVFQALFALGDQEDEKHKTTIILNFPDMSYEALLGFVQFFYSGTVQHEVMKKHAPPLLCAAIKFEVKYLQGLCEKYVKDRATWNRKNLIWAFQVAKEAGSTTLLSFCESHAKSKLIVRNLDWALEVAYKSGSKALMEAALKIVLPKIHQLLTFDDSRKDESELQLTDASQLLKTYQTAAVKSLPRSKSSRGSKSPYKPCHGKEYDEEDTTHIHWPESSSSRDAQELDGLDILLQVVSFEMAAGGYMMACMCLR